jgi:hypothetical protein
LELSITTTRSRPLRRISALVCVFACFLAAPVLAKKTPEEKAQEKDEKAAAKEAAEKARLLQVFVSEPYLGDMAGFTTHNWEIGIGGGDYGGANLINAYGAWSLTDNMKVELTLSQFLGNASNGYKAEAGLTHVIFPEWRVSPFLELGTGVVYVEPRATIVLPDDRTDQTAYVGAGVRVYLTRRFFVRADYRWHTIFTSRDDNEELEEWKVLIACFF